MWNRKWIAGLSLIVVLFVIVADVAAQGPPGSRGPSGRGGRPSFDQLLLAFDANDDSALSADEVPGRVWARLSQADANRDGVVTRGEFESYRP